MSRPFITMILINRNCAESQTEIKGSGVLRPGRCNINNMPPKSYMTRLALTGQWTFKNDQKNMQSSKSIGKKETLSVAIHIDSIIYFKFSKQQNILQIFNI